MPCVFPALALCLHLRYGAVAAHDTPASRTQGSAYCASASVPAAPDAPNSAEHGEVHWLLRLQGSG
jgi:hypothetical protein